MFVTASCGCASESALVPARDSCPATLTLYARPMVIILLLLVDLQSLCRVMVLSRGGSGGLPLYGGFSLRTVGPRCRWKGVPLNFGDFVGEIAALSTN